MHLVVTLKEWLVGTNLLPEILGKIHPPSFNKMLSYRIETALQRAL